MQHAGMRGRQADHHGATCAQAAEHARVCVGERLTTMAPPALMQQLLTQARSGGVAVCSSLRRRPQLSGGASPH